MVIFCDIEMSAQKERAIIAAAAPKKQISPRREEATQILAQFSDEVVRVLSKEE